MTKTPNIIAIIPARGGSKGYPDKNISHYKGKSLLERAIHLGNHCTLINEVYVSSDKNEYLEVAEKAGSKIHLRSKQASSDTASMKEVLLEVHKYLSQWDQENCWYVLIYPTFAQNTRHELDSAIRAYVEKSGDYADGLIGIRKPVDHPYLMVELDAENRLINSINPDFNKYYRRQDYPPYWSITHQTVIIPADAVCRINNQLIGDQTYFHPIEHISVDVDYKTNLSMSATINE